MPPQGMPHPAEAEYVGFTSWLAGSLDRAWEGTQHAGPLRRASSEPHRVRATRFAICWRSTSTSPSCCRATARTSASTTSPTSLKTSPLLLERYLTAAQRISTLAVGDPSVRPGTTEYSISREFTQSGYIDGLPLGTRGGTVIRHVFPADGEYKLSGRLVRGVEEGYAGVEGNDQPHTFIITVDGAEVYSAQIGGPKDHEVQARDMNEARVAHRRAHDRHASRVTAGPHDVGFTWKERPFERQDVWQPARRDSQEVHMIAGLPRLKTVGVEGPYNVTGISKTPSRERLFVCQPSVGRRRAGLRQRRSSRTWRGAPTGGP